MFSYYGSKASITWRYPKPEHKLIIEPFAGSAKYSCLWYTHDVMLFDVDPRIVRTWKYLISASSQDIMKLPLMPKGTKIDSLDVSDDAKIFLGYMISAAPSVPMKTASEKTNWTTFKRQEIATMVPKVKHWQVYKAYFARSPDIEATWFIDPPYQVMGQHYQYKLMPYVYPEIAQFARTRQGQVIVCENMGANWLPFSPLVTIGGQKNNNRTEAIWTNQPCSCK